MKVHGWRLFRVGWLTLALLGAALLLAACSSGPGDSAGPGADPGPTATPTVEADAPDDPVTVLTEYLDAWTANDWDRLPGLVSDPSLGTDIVHRSVWETLGVTDTTLTVTREIDPAAANAAGPVVAGVEVAVELDELGTWTYPTEVTLVQAGDRWVIEWTPATVHPALIDGRQLVANRSWPGRGAILGFGGAPLRVSRPVVSVGIEPRRVEDREQLLTDLEAILGVDPAEIEASLDAPGVQPDWFVPVAVVADDVEPLTQAALEGLAGVVLRESEQRQAPTREFARQVLGDTGPITAEQLDAWGPPYAVGDIVGQFGLELAHEDELAGRPGGDVRVVDASGETVAVLFRQRGTEPVDVVTTLDPDIQRAAEAALGEVELPAALIAIDAASGEVRAVVSNPVDGFGRAFSGAYPPGSTFKIITAGAALTGGLTPSSPTPCPPTTSAGGLVFTNAGGSSLGGVDMATAFAASCNTAFVDLAVALGADAIDAAAATFGVGVELGTGLGALGGSLPDPVDDAELAAQAIGQGRVTVSPLFMASVAAAVADGAWREPVLVTDPPGAEPEERPLPRGGAPDLRSMMRGVVTGGTAGALTDVSGEVIAKTGSAEFGSEDPPLTHAWVVGARDGLAFAVVVEGGGGGGSVAAPVAAAFLRALD